MDTLPLMLASAVLSLELLSTLDLPLAMLALPHTVSPMDTLPLISLARGALSPTAPELLFTLGTPPATLAQPPLACPITSLARGVPSPMEPELPMATTPLS